MSTVAFPDQMTSIDARPLSASCTSSVIVCCPLSFVPFVGGGQIGGWLPTLPKLSADTVETVSFGSVTVYTKSDRLTVAPPVATDWSTVLPVCVQPDCCTSASVQVVVPLDAECAAVVYENEPDESVVTVALVPSLHEIVTCQPASSVSPSSS